MGWLWGTRGQGLAWTVALDRTDVRPGLWRRVASARAAGFSSPGSAATYPRPVRRRAGDAERCSGLADAPDGRGCPRGRMAERKISLRRHGPENRFAGGPRRPGP